MKCPDAYPLKGMNYQCYACDEPPAVELLNAHNPTCSDRVVVSHTVKRRTYPFSILNGATYNLNNVSLFVIWGLLGVLILYALLWIGCPNASQKVKIGVFVSPVIVLLIVFLVNTILYSLMRS